LKEDTIKHLILGLMRYSFWGGILYLWLHFIYANAISFMPWNVYQLPLSTVYGLVLCLGQYFMLKYTVIYGISATLAGAEGVEMPQPPKCISRIHLYSDMWRVFDPGLYKFLNRCAKFIIDYKNKLLRKTSNI
jgi:protein-cysteine N-palmitoyltransferase HHAT